MAIPLDWHAHLVDAGKLAAAYVLGLPVGWFKEKEIHAFGLRTFPLVALASCGYVLLGSPAYVHSPEAQSRIIQGLVAGMGFIGGAAIFRSPEGSVHGTSTAASIWNTGALGAAVATDRWVLAIVLSLFNLFALRVLLPVKMKLDGTAEERALEQRKSP
ncbi:MAG: MgtC/SapB family protein [Bryobacteraceae bacterium]|jgi:putative Mg2+ transporter-C (MgtC) family protein